jgi:uncharacterized protein YbcV (DUF1398 family)
MNQQLTVALNELAGQSLAGTITFPAVIGRLLELGVERYHADYSRSETTYYLADGESLVVALSHEPHTTADEFDAATVEAAVRQSQCNEHTYLDFVRKTMAAGCVGYFVQIAGRRVQYFGRRGEIHTELFPAAPSP